jgi:sialic acid synthase SpsE
MFEINGIKVGGQRTVVIAEAGVNHLGRMDYAEELIKSAARSGADIIKFQTYKADKLSTRKAPRFWSWEGESDQNGSQHDSYSKLDSFEKENYEKLIEICDNNNITFMSTPFDEESADMLVDIGMKAFKIASCDLTNLPFLRHIAKKKLPVLISTGASTIKEIQAAVDVITKENNHNIVIMHCTLCYPTDPKDSNLSALNDIKVNFNDYILGFSDHTLGTIVPAASVLYGVKVIEKHYTFDKTLPHSADHWLSLDEEELTTLVNQVRELEVSIGNGKKELLECEIPAYKYARRSIVADRVINPGTIITSDMLTSKRPGTGLSPVYFDKVVGSTAKNKLIKDQLIKFDDLI